MLYAYLLAQVVDIIISVLIFMLFARIMIALFVAEGSSIESFLSIFTEPVISPMRRVLAKSEFFSSIPIDYSMQLSLLVLVFVSFILMFFQI